MFAAAVFTWLGAIACNLNVKLTISKPGNRRVFYAWRFMPSEITTK
jgi:hypothetical protein